jgi:hypothetical protein
MTTLIVGGSAQRYQTSTLIVGAALWLADLCVRAARRLLSIGDVEPDVAGMMRIVSKRLAPEVDSG